MNKQTSEAHDRLRMSANDLFSPTFRRNTGLIWVNCWLVRDLGVPFGGMKQSGVGREGGDEALRFFTEPKNVCIAK